MTPALLVLLGHPVAHSRSPAMMNAALRAAKVDAVYVARDVAPAALADALGGLRAQGFAGANITLPHKIAAVELVDRLDSSARAIGAINTIVRDGQTLVGHNTDVAGVVEALREAGHTAAGRRVVVLGTGGAARAAAVGLALAGARSLHVLGRRAAMAVAVAVSAQTVAPECVCGGWAIPSPEAGAALSAADIVVQATSCGMEGGPPADTLLAAADLRLVPQGAAALDLVYVPARTAWMDAGAGAGLHVVGGAGVLVHQGAVALRLWFGMEADIRVMREALARALNDSSSL